MPKVTFYICPSYYNGDTFLGYNAEGDVEVEIVSLDIDAELPDLWELTTLEEADAALSELRRMLDTIQSIEHPFPLTEADTEFVIDDLLYEIEQAELIRAAFERGEDHPYDAEDADPAVSYALDPYGLAAVAEPIVELDDLPANLREALEEFCDELHDDLSY